MAESSNYPSAFAFYASGFKLDPREVAVHEEAVALAARYHSQGGEAATGKAIKAIDDGGPMDAFVSSLYAWWHDIDDPRLAIGAIAAGIESGQREFSCAMAEKVLALARGGGRVPSVKELKRLMHLFKAAGAWNQAIIVGQNALQLKPEDSVLEKELNELAAERAMAEGGYNDIAGDEGGFRRMVRDLDHQRELEEEDSISGSGGSSDRVLERARTEWEEHPQSPDIANKYAQLLRRQATPESIKAAIGVYMQAFEATGEYRFRTAAGDLKIEQARDHLRGLESAGDAAAVEAARGELLAFRKQEYEDRAVKYPTDRGIRYQLGDIALESGDINLAMECFQKAKDEPSLRVRAGHALGRCFASEDWHTEAVAEFQEALKVLAGSDATAELSIRYDLMRSLADKAQRDKNADLAREALDICSTIARKDITYRDIRDCRRELDELVKELD